MIDDQIRHTANARRFQVCTKTVMDTTDPDITFDAAGVCHYWHEFQAFRSKLPDRATRDRQCAEVVARIKTAGRTKPYDCLLGLSGGVDSSYVACLSKELGLRPLVVHFDNGWNSELAVSNIEQLVTKLGYDLETFVMDWDEFRDVQRAYFKASVVDIEVPTDHMIWGALHKIAAKHGIKTILGGMNYETEWLLPKAWYYPKGDLVNLKGIHKQFGELKLRTLPTLGVWQRAFYHARGIRTVNLLDLTDFDKDAAKRRLTAEFGWRDYGGKHYESVFTRFYQGYVLPRKFGADKRKAHLSNLILSGKMTREAALRELQQPTYDEDQQQQDKQYVGKKLGFSPVEFDAILAAEPRPHEEFGTDSADRARYNRAVGLLNALRRRR